MTSEACFIEDSCTEGWCRFSSYLPGASGVCDTNFQDQAVKEGSCYVKGDECLASAACCIMIVLLGVLCVCVCMCMCVGGWEVTFLPWVYVRVMCGDYLGLV